MSALLASTVGGALAGGSALITIPTHPWLCVLCTLVGVVAGHRAWQP